MLLLIKFTSIKKYFAYKEEDELGGVDPYSASKVCSEIISNCYKIHFLRIEVI